MILKQKNKEFFDFNDVQEIEEKNHFVEIF
jgi:hypothetical protein